MCMSVKTPKPPEPPAAPPPPTAVAETVKEPATSDSPQKKRRGGVASLVLKRPTVGGLGSTSGTGVNTSNY